MCEGTHKAHFEIAVRESMLNAIVHRDYGFSGSIIVNIYDDHIEFVSLGGLVTGLWIEDLFVGVSQPRNEKLANVFYRLKHIEAYGTGKRLMATENTKVISFKTIPSYFCISLLEKPIDS